VALSSCAFATSRLAWACVRLFWGMRGSTFASNLALLHLVARLDGHGDDLPDALDLTLRVRIGWITPDAVAETMMSRRATATVS